MLFASLMHICPDQAFNEATLHGPARLTEVQGDAFAFRHSTKGSSGTPATAPALPHLRYRGNPWSLSAWLRSRRTESRYSKLLSDLVQISNDRWRTVNQQMRENLTAFREGLSEGWRDLMKNGWKKLAYEFYVEPFILLFGVIKRASAAIMGR